MKIDFHIHTFHSECSDLRPEDAIKRAGKVGLDAIALISHNINPKITKSNKVRVIPGVEVSTKEGHILIVNTDKEFPKGLPAQEVIEMAPKTALIIIPHPFDSFRKGVNSEIVNLKGYHAIEVNARCLSKKFNLKAIKFAKENNIPLVAGSDAHFVEEIGNAFTIVNAKTIDEAIAKIKQGQTRIYVKKRSFIEKLNPFIRSMVPKSLRAKFPYNRQVF